MALDNNHLVKLTYKKRARTKRVAASGWVSINLLAKTNLYGALTLFTVATLVYTNTDIENILRFINDIYELENLHEEPLIQSLVLFTFGIGRVILSKMYANVEKKEKRFAAVTILPFTILLNIAVFSFMQTVNANDFEGWQIILANYLKFSPIFYIIIKIYIAITMLIPKYTRNSFA